VTGPQLNTHEINIIGSIAAPKRNFPVRHVAAPALPDKWH
jgi:hypothetical protein